MNDENIKPHEFQKGQSGNPAGRPKGSKNLKTVMRDYFNGKMRSYEYDDDVQVDVSTEFMSALFEEAILRKDFKVFKFIFKEMRDIEWD